MNPNHNLEETTAFISQYSCLVFSSEGLEDVEERERQMSPCGLRTGGGSRTQREAWVGGSRTYSARGTEAEETSSASCAFSDPDQS